MGNIIHVLVIDENKDRVNQLRENLSIHAPDIKIDHTTDILSFIHLVETNTYNCILSSELDLVTKKELISNIIQLIKVPRLTYLGDTRLPESTQKNQERARLRTEY